MELLDHDVECLHILLNGDQNVAVGSFNSRLPDLGFKAAARTVRYCGSKPR